MKQWPPLSTRTLLADIRTIWPLMADHRLSLIAMVVLGVASALAEAVMFSLVIFLIYILVDGSDRALSGNAGGLMHSASAVIGRSPYVIGASIAGLILAKDTLAAVYGLTADWIASLATHRARVGIFRRYLDGSYADAAAEHQSSIVNEIGHEAGTISVVIVQLAQTAINVCAIAILGLYIAYISTYLAAAIVLLGVTFIVLFGFWARTLAQLGAKVNAINEKLFARMLVGIQALRTIRMYASEAAFIREFEACSRSVEETAFKLTKLNYVSRPIRDAGVLAMLAGVLFLSSHNNIGAPEIVTIVALLYRILPHATAMEDQIIGIFGIAVPFHNAVETIAQTTGEGGRGPQEFDGRFKMITLEDVCFSYRGAERPTLENISFELPRGAVALISGPSGGGKTTLVNLLARLHAPDTGRITVDGVCLNEISRSSWSRHAAFAGQDVELIEGSIFENVRLRRSGYSERDVYEVLKVTQALEFIDELPGGIHAEVGDRGLWLSGGQRQRIGLARALVGHPKILVLDEATNAIDSKMEENILNDVRRFLSDATFIIITHRPSISDAAVVVSLDKGRAVTHSLVAKRLGREAAFEMHESRSAL
jgi:ABC-type multidrug transport system fused ATPase/permease subunit